MGVGGAGRRFAVLLGEVIALGRAAEGKDLFSHSFFEHLQYPSAGFTTDNSGSSFKYKRRLSMNVAYIA